MFVSALKKRKTVLRKTSGGGLAVLTKTCIAPNALFITAFMAFQVWSQVALTGTVENCCGEPIAGAVVVLSQLGYSATTGRDGKFAITSTASLAAPQAGLSGRFRASFIDVFDLRGRCLLYHVKAEDRARIETLAQSSSFAQLFVVKLSNDRQEATVQTTCDARSFLRHWSQRFQGSAGLKKNVAIADTLCVTATNYTKKKLRITDLSKNIGGIGLTRLGDDFADCSQQRALTDSLAAIGISFIADSLAYSPAFYEWSAQGLKTPLSGSKRYCLLDAQPTGFFTECTSAGCSGYSSSSISGAFASAGIPNLNWILTLTGHIGNLLCTEGTRFDKSPYICLFSGYALDSNKRYIDTIHYVNNALSSLPFDSLVLIEYFKSLNGVYARYFQDSGAYRQDTLLLNSTTVNPSSAAIVFNSHGAIRCPVVGKTIVAGGSLILDSGADIRHCSIMAGKIVINNAKTDFSTFFSIAKTEINAGQHNSQFFCCDSIVIGSQASSEPQSLWISQRTQTNYACIYMKRNRNLCGTAICFRNYAIPNISVSICVEDSSSFKGYLITDGEISIKHAEVTGKMYAGSFDAYYKNIHYTNYLFGVTMHQETTPLPFPLFKPGWGPVMFFQSGKSIQCY